MKRRHLVLVALSLLAAPLAHAQETEIESVILDQIEAFRADDFAAAFDHASPGIKQLFGTPERFGRMVRQGYPMVHRPAEVDFLGTRDAGNTRKQRVTMRDSGGAIHILEYDMIERDGRWRIDGVRLIEAPEVGA